MRAADSTGLETTSQQGATIHTRRRHQNGRSHIPSRDACRQPCSSAQQKPPQPPCSHGECKLPYMHATGHALAMPTAVQPQHPPTTMLGRAPALTYAAAAHTGLLSCSATMQAPPLPNINSSLISEEAGGQQLAAVAGAQSRLATLSYFPILPYPEHDAQARISGSSSSNLLPPAHTAHCCKALQGCARVLPATSGSLKEETPRTCWCMRVWLGPH